MYLGVVGISSPVYEEPPFDLFRVSLVDSCIGICLTCYAGISLVVIHFPGFLVSGGPDTRCCTYVQYLL